MLSSESEATVRLQRAGREHALTVSLERFESLSEPLLLRLRAPVERALRDARIRAAELDRIVLAGGATRMPMRPINFGKPFVSLFHVRPPSTDL